MKRLVLVCLIASVLVTAPAGVASACSCATLEPAEALAFHDAAFVGRLVERPSSDGPYREDAPYVFEVETWVKDDLGSEIVVYAPNQGSACGFEAAIGERVGVLVMVSGGKARGGLCSTVDADLLLAGDQPYAIDGSGQPSFLVAGYEGSARLMLLDSSGGLLTTVGEDGESLNGLAMCPGGGSFVEMVNDQLVVRTVSDLEEVRRVDLDGLPYEVAVPRIWCRDQHGAEVWLSTDSWSEETGIAFELLDAANLDEPLFEGGYGWLEVGDAYAVAGEGPTGELIWRIDLQSGQRSVLHEVPVEAGDSPPSGRGWMDPSGQSVMITQWRYRDGTGGSTKLFLYAVDSGQLLWESETLPTGDGVGWVDDSSFLVSSYLEMDGEHVEYLLINTEDHEIVLLDDVPGWRTLRVGDKLAGVSDASLQVIPLTGGEPASLRLLPTEAHRLVAVLDADATITPRAQSAPSVVETVETAAGPAPEGDQSTPRNQWPWAVASGAILAALALALPRYRNRRRATQGRAPSEPTPTAKAHRSPNPEQ